MSLSPAPPDIPEWIHAALAHEAAAASVAHAGAALHYRTWGTPGRPAVVLIHGALAHSHWWDWVAPRLARRYFVLAPDLAGMGESGHRPAYAIAGLADDVRAVMAHAGAGADTVVVGHSLGGLVALACAARHAQAMRAVVMLDAAVYPPHLPSPFDPASAPNRPKTVCADAASAAARFFLLPPQPCPWPALVNYVAAHSVAPVHGGWTWKFDDQFFRRLAVPEPWRDLEALELPLAMIMGERSAVMTPPVRAYLEGLAQVRRWPLLTLPDAHHHLMLDAPRALCAALEGLLAGWPA